MKAIDKLLEVPVRDEQLPALMDTCPKCGQNHLHAICKTLTTYCVSNTRTGTQEWNYQESDNDVGEVAFVICQACGTTFWTVEVDADGDIIGLEEEPRSRCACTEPDPYCEVCHGSGVVPDDWDPDAEGEA